jgi:hypothetical protein
VTPLELFDLCVDAVKRWKNGEMIGDEPFVTLVVPRDRVPTGRTIRLLGRFGPQGRIATVKERKDGRFDVVAYFPAKRIIELIKNG